MQAKTKLTIAALAALSMLGACSRSDDGRTAGERVDGAVAKVEQQAERAKDATGNAADKVAEKSKDMGITTSINAELARDPRLSALKINVDTEEGRVTLRGTAPDSAARDRATSLANAVGGVLAVDNQLVVSAPN